MGCLRKPLILQGLRRPGGSIRVGADEATHLRARRESSLSYRLLLQILCPFRHSRYRIWRCSSCGPSLFLNESGP